MCNSRSIRIVAFDHVRGMAVMGMIISHVVLMFGSHAAHKTFIGHFMYDFCGTVPAAPVFMMLMGVFFSYPHDKPMLTKVARGAKIFLLGILLNIARFVIPMTLAGIFFPETANMVKSELHLDAGETYWRLFYNLDILEFAGLAFAIMALLQGFVKKSLTWIILSIVVVFAAPYLWGIGQNWGIYYNFVQPLWCNKFLPDAGDTSFPVFPWLVYPIAGLLIGKLLAAGTDRQIIFKKMLFSGVALLAIGAGIVIVKTIEEFGDYWRMYPGGTFMVLGFALIWTCMFMWFEQKDFFQKFLSRLNFWSVNITLAYCVQWILFGFSGLFLGHKQIDNSWALLALSPVFIMVSYFVTVLMLRWTGFIRYFRWFTK